jgi:hypothetical protein
VRITGLSRSEQCPRRPEPARGGFRAQHLLDELRIHEVSRLRLGWVESQRPVVNQQIRPNDEVIRIFIYEDGSQLQRRSSDACFLEQLSRCGLVIGFAPAGSAHMELDAFHWNRKNLTRALFDSEGVLWWIVRTYRKRRREIPFEAGRPEYEQAEFIVLRSPTAADSFLKGRRRSP